MKLENSEREQEKLKFTTAEVDKKKNRLEEINQEIKKLIDENTQKCNKLESEFKISELSSQSDAKVLKEGIELLEKDRIECEQNFISVVQELENEIRNYKSESVKEISKLTGQINQLTTEKEIIKQEHENAKEKLNLVMNDTKAASSLEMEKIKEKISQNEADIKQLTEQFSQKENELEAELFNIFVNSSSVNEELETEIEKLRKEKSDLAEQNLGSLQKKQRELFEKESSLKKEVDALKTQIELRSSATVVMQVSSADHSAEISRLKTEIEGLRNEKKPIGRTT